MEPLNQLLNSSVCLHTFSHPGKRGLLIRLCGNYIIVPDNQESWITINLDKVDIIEDDHIFMKGYNGQTNQTS